MNESAQLMIIRIYEMLLLHHDAAFESLHASTALVQAVAEKQPDLWGLYHKKHLELIAKSAKREAELRSQIEEIIQRLRNQ